MACQIGDLPDEILVWILNFLPKPDLKSARLTCTRWSQIGAARLFDRIFFAPQKETLMYFEGVSNNPVFGRNISELIYDARLFRDHKLNYRRYKYTYNAVEDDEANNRSKAYRVRVEESRLRYAMLFAQQEFILETGYDYGLLCNAFRRMPNIHTITIIDTFSGSRLSEAYPWYYDRSIGGRGPAVQPSRWGEDLHGPGGSYPDVEKWDCRGFLNLIRAVSRSQLVVKEFNIGSHLSHARLEMFRLSLADGGHLCNITRHLTTLRLSWGTMWHKRFANFEEVVPCVKDALADTKSLRHLEVNIPRISDILKEVFLDVFLKLHRPRLETLVAMVVPLTPKDLSAFAEAHKHTLRHIVISDGEFKVEDGFPREALLRWVPQGGNFKAVRSLRIHDEWSSV